MEKTTSTVVLYPGVGVGHLTPMLELAKVLLGHGAGTVDVAVMLVESPFEDPGFAATVARAKASHTSVAFHVLPSPGPDGEQQDDDQHPVAGLLRFLRATTAPLRDLLRALSSASRPVGAVVLDMFCADALDAAAELRLPAYFFFPSGAAALSVFLALPATRASLGAAGFNELGDAVLRFAGAPPVKASELPRGTASEPVLHLASRMPEARGILVNSFEALEPRAVQALRDGLCLPHRPTPPIYCVGPLVSAGGAGKAEHACLRWLDAQPDRSVVFLCFGSMGAFPESQLEEIAAGLESSGERFLWVVRRSPSPGAGAGADLDAVLPAGFRERTRDRGLVVASWAPQ